ncbi:YesL family protein [Intestinibacter sp.]
MGKIFDYNNSFFSGISKISDTIVLNFIFVICSIPIVTIGASVTALYSVSMKITRDEDVYVVREFFKQFKENFKKSTIIWLILLLIAVFIGIDFYMCSLISQSIMSIVFKFIFTLMSIVVGFVLVYAFPLLARFENNIKNILKNSILMSIQYLPYTLIMLVLTLMPALAFVLLSQYWGQIIFLNTCISFGFIAYINSILLNKIFNKYIEE